MMPSKEGKGLAAEVKSGLRLENCPIPCDAITDL
jgi:hypothetical protein